MPDASPREIRIGDATYRIARFKGLKASLAGALMSRVMREVPQLQERVSTFRKEFRQKNTLVMTPAMAKLPRFEPLGLTTEDFKAAGGNIELPEEPDQGTIMMHLFPEVFDLADKELRKFLAIIVIPNSELEEADDGDEVDDVLAKWGKRLMREGDIDELLELVVIGLEVLREQMASKRDALGKLPIPLVQALLAEPEKVAEETGQVEESNGHGPTSPIPTEETLSPSLSSVPPSSGDSPPNLDGTEEPLSTTSPGTN